MLVLGEKVPIDPVRLSLNCILVRLRQMVKGAGAARREGTASRPIHGPPHHGQKEERRHEKEEKQAQEQGRGF